MVSNSISRLLLHLEQTGFQFENTKARPEYLWTSKIRDSTSTE